MRADTGLKLPDVFVEAAALHGEPRARARASVASFDPRLLRAFECARDAAG